ncbi:unnamed protein product [Meganyctiphanes norvegica]|uniref:Cysteine/serine-rich nuclear protein N-terminal domain-containing protein n=1 Tax=Meganyctiphanes norvegica TaxID=48144 RepID=A0AAV2QKZ7_MEGNR
MITIMDDQLMSKLNSLKIGNQPKKEYEIADELNISTNLTSSENVNIRRSSPRLKVSQEKQKNSLCDAQNPIKFPLLNKNFSPNKIKQIECDTEINNIQETDNSYEKKTIKCCAKFQNEDQFILYSKSPSIKNVNVVEKLCSLKTPDKTKSYEIDCLSLFPQKNILQQRKCTQIDHCENTNFHIATIKNSTASNCNVVSDVDNSSGVKTPEQCNSSLKIHSVKTPRFKKTKEKEAFNVDKTTNASAADSQNLQLNEGESPEEDHWQTPNFDEEKCERKVYNKPVWLTPHIKSRHQRMRINLKTPTEIVTEKHRDITTSTPCKSSDVLLESPGIDNFYPKVASPSVNEHSNTSIQTGYSSSDDVPSTESSICSTSSISKLNVSFGKAKVYCFDRCFGLDTVPDEGEFALGMSQVPWETMEFPLYDNPEELSKSMQKLTIDQRRSLLEESCGSVELNDLDGASGTFISPEIAAIRSAREQVGCQCRGTCDPVVCECALSQIECQVERAGWPCGCTRLRCKNPEGRRQYEQAKVKKETRIKIMQIEGK